MCLLLLMRKQKEFNVSAGIVLAVFLSFVTYQWFPGYQASANDSAEQETVIAVEVVEEQIVPSQNEEITVEVVEEVSVSEEGDDSNEIVVVEEQSQTQDTEESTQDSSDGLVWEGFSATNDSTEENPDSLPNDEEVGDNNDSTETEEIIESENSQNNDESSVSVDNTQDEEDNSFASSWVVNSGVIATWVVSTWIVSTWVVSTGINASGTLLNREDAELSVEEDIYVPPVSDEKQDILIFDEDAYIEEFNSEDFLWHTVPRLTEEQVFELDDKDIIDQYIVDNGRINVKITKGWTYLKVKLK